MVITSVTYIFLFRSTDDCLSLQEMCSAFHLFCQLLCFMLQVSSALRVSSSYRPISNDVLWSVAETGYSPVKIQGIIHIWDLFLLCHYEYVIPQPWDVRKQLHACKRLVRQINLKRLILTLIKKLIYLWHIAINFGRQFIIYKSQTRQSRISPCQTK